MIFTFAIPTMASVNQNSSDMINEASNNISFLEDTTNKQYSKYTLGNKISLYRVKGSQIVEANDMKIYPIYGDSNVVGIYEVYSDGGSSFGESYASNIDRAVKNGINNFFMIANGNQVYLSDGKKTELLFIEAEGGLYSTDEYESTIDEESANKKQIESDKTKINFSRDKVSSAQENNKENIKTLEPSMDLAELKLKVTTTNFEKNTDFNKDCEFGIADITPVRTKSFVNGSNYKYIKTGHINQGNTCLCWAVCTKLVGKYVGSGSYTIEEIADEMKIGYNKGANDKQIVDALDKCYGVWAERKGYYNHDNLKKWIDKDKPVIGHWDELYGHMDHAVTIVGYYTDSDAIVISESLNGYDKYRKVNATNGRHQYSYVSGRKYKYIASVVLEW